MPTEDQLARLEDWAQPTINPPSVVNAYCAVTVAVPPPPPPSLRAEGTPPPPPPPPPPASVDVQGLQEPTPPPSSLISLNSFNSCLPPLAYSADWPRPLEIAAYHGLGGRIVRLIEPHTESDLGALLVQFLVAFGNVIGRTAHRVVDGTEHYFNLFATIVGDSAKARKGTSWNQIARLFKRVDPDWHDKRIESGMSSGEGLIYAIRDPIIGKKAGRGDLGEDDEPEFVIKDPGIEDKRLLVSEGEFAQCLKVMSREGNTLSPVIRLAWDGRKLNTLVKNNQVSVMKPHVSIIGHITREELLRQLSQSDLFNGLANRFLWLAATRSKLLPEGGRIGEVNFNAEIVELQSAICFARTAGEVRWAEPTLDLWRTIYRNLSETKPGILGSVTARGEAQVLRLSGIYALLDGTAIIQPEHLQAAMALWGYCERSARWIFGTKTGDKDADKLLTALRSVHPEGLTNTQISKSVFRANTPACEIRQALDLLSRIGLVESRSELTAGATATRWILKGEARN